MGRRRIRPVRGPEHGIARGALQRAVLSRLLAGDTLTVVGVRDGQPRRAPAGMTRRSWTALRKRIEAHGYLVEEGVDDYAHGIFDTYRLTRLVDAPDAQNVI